ncbi:MAG: Rrf2 family transcriptional regulator [Bdellovibrionales bacterium]
MNKKTEYALIALKHLQEREQGYLMSAKEVTETYQTPFDATSRVLQRLASGNWLVSEQGAHGGYKLSKDLDQLSFKELMEIIEGPQSIVKCLAVDASAKKCDLVETCNMVSPLSNLNTLLLNFLDELSVGDLIRSNSDKKIEIEKLSRLQAVDLN